MILQAVVALQAQFRMAGDIQLLANTLVYNGSLRCGSTEVESGMLQTDVPFNLLKALPQWLLEVRLFAKHSRFGILSIVLFTNQRGAQL